MFHSSKWKINSDDIWLLGRYIFKLWNNNVLEFVFLHGHNLNLFTQKRFIQQQTYKYAANEAKTGLRTEIASAGTVTINDQNQRMKSKMEGSATFLTMEFYKIHKKMRNQLLHDWRVQNRRKRTLRKLNLLEVFWCIVLKKL